MAPPAVLVSHMLPLLRDADPCSFHIYTVTSYIYDHGCDKIWKGQAIQGLSKAASL